MSGAENAKKRLAKAEDASSRGAMKTKAGSGQRSRVVRTAKAEPVHRRGTKIARLSSANAVELRSWPQFFGRVLGGVGLVICALILGWRAFVLFSTLENRFQMVISGAIYLFMAVMSLLVGGLLLLQREVASYWRGLMFLALAAFFGLLYCNASEYIDYIGFPRGQGSFLAVCSMILTTMLVIEVVVCVVAAVMSFRKQVLPVLLLWIMILALVLSMILFSFWQFEDYRSVSCLNSNSEYDLMACSRVDAELAAIVIMDLAIYTVGIMAGYFVSVSRREQ